MGRKIGFGLVGLLLICGIVAGAFALGRQETTVKVTRPKLVKVTDTVSGKGQIQPGAVAQVSSLLPVVIGKAYCQPGQQVQAGQLLYEVDLESTKAAYLGYLRGWGFDPAIDTLKKLKTFLEKLPKAVWQVVEKQLPQGAVAWLEQMEEKMTIHAALSAFEDMVPQKINAPASGYLKAQSISFTALCGGQTPLAEIVGQSEQEICLQIKQSDYQKIKVGQTATLSGATLKKALRLKVARIGDKATGGFALLADQTSVPVYFALPQGEYLNGAAIEGKIAVGQAKEILLVPYEAISQDEAGEFVYVWQDGKALRQPIETGREYAAGCEVTRGITADTLLLKWNDKQLPPSDTLRLEMEGTEDA